jgi:hypothetical protein
MSSYPSAITTFLTRFPSGTPIITMTLALDKEKPGFWIPESGYIDQRKFAAWYAASLAAVRRLNKGLKP